MEHPWAACPIGCKVEPPVSYNQKGLKKQYQFAAKLGTVPPCVLNRKNRWQGSEMIILDLNMFGMIWLIWLVSQSVVQPFVIIFFISGSESYTLKKNEHVSNS